MPRSMTTLFWWTFHGHSYLTLDIEVAARDQALTVSHGPGQAKTSSSSHQIRTNRTSTGLPYDQKGREACGDAMEMGNRLFNATATKLDPNKFPRSGLLTTDLGPFRLGLRTAHVARLGSKSAGE
jgi:hypothetical protein